MPATSSPPGAGVDALGLAVDLRDELLVRVAGRACAPASGPSPATPVCRQVRTTWCCGRCGRPSPRWAGRQPSSRRFVPRVPMSRGLGSSAAALCAVVTAALALAGDESVQVSRDVAAAALPIAARVEGHPDNVAACLSAASPSPTPVPMDGWRWSGSSRHRSSARSLSSRDRTPAGPAPARQTRPHQPRQDHHPSLHPA